MTLIARAAADLKLVAEYWPGLAELRDPAVFAPRPPSELTSEQQAERDYEARIERHERDGLMPGEHPDAARAAVLDLMASLTIDADTLVETVSSAIPSPWARPALPSSAFADPLPLLAFTFRHLAHVDEQTLMYVARDARQMLRDVSRALCLTYDGQALAAVCPWCKGRTETAPLGGVPTWRVRDLLGHLPCDHGHDDRALCVDCDQHIAIVCESGTCEPPTKDVGTWWRQRPAWPMAEWEWLANRVAVQDRLDKIPSLA